MISLIVFNDKYLEHLWTFYTNGFSFHSNYIPNYIQIHSNKDPSWECKHYMFNKQFFKSLTSELFTLPSFALPSHTNDGSVNDGSISIASFTLLSFTSFSTLP